MHEKRNKVCSFNIISLQIDEVICKKRNTVNGNIELDKNVNVGIGQFVPILFSLIDIIKLSFLKIDRS